MVGTSGHSCSKRRSGCERGLPRPQARTSPASGLPRGLTVVGRRSRARARRDPHGAPAPEAPSSDYTDAQGNTLTLRGSLTPKARTEYAQTLSRERGPAAATREDAEQRALELLFERLAVRWTISGAPIERPRELLARLRAATPGERAWVTKALREHCAEWFPDVQAP